MATAKQAITIEGLKPALAALTRMGKEASGKARDASLKIAAKEAPRIAAAGRGSSRQSALVAGTVRARRDRVPAIAMGGAGKLSPQSGGHPRAGDVAFGAEFGGGARRTTQQFRPHLGQQGYWFLADPTRRRRGDVRRVEPCSRPYYGRVGAGLVRDNVCGARSVGEP